MKEFGIFDGTESLLFGIIRDKVKITWQQEKTSRFIAKPQCEISSSEYISNIIYSGLCIELILENIFP